MSNPDTIRALIAAEKATAQRYGAMAKEETRPRFRVRWEALAKYHAAQAKRWRNAR